MYDLPMYQQKLQAASNVYVYAAGATPDHMCIRLHQLQVQLVQGEEDHDPLGKYLDHAQQPKFNPAESVGEAKYCLKSLFEGRWHTTTFWVLRQPNQGEPIGLISTSPQMMYIPNVAVITGFVLLPEYRNKGYGRRFITAVIAAMHEYYKPLHAITLGVLAKNASAAHLYDSLGFKPLHASLWLKP